MRKFLIFMAILILLLVGAVGVFGSINEFEQMGAVGVVMPTNAVSASNVDSVTPQPSMMSALYNDAIAPVVSQAQCLTDCGAQLHACSIQAHASRYINYLHGGNPAYGGVADRLIFPYHTIQMLLG